MNDYSKNDKTRAIATTALLHGVLLLLFLFFGLRTPLPLPAEEGVLIALGSSDHGIGEFVQQTSAAPQPQRSVPTTSTEEVVTQDTEESVALPPATTQTRPVTSEEPPRPTTTQQQQPQEPQPRPDPRALFPGTNQSGTTAQSQGTTGQPGSQGDPTGSPTGAPSGSGQGGVSYSLGDRGHTHLDIPQRQPGKFGRVVVAIYVNRQGVVTRAVAGGRGSTTLDRTLYDLCERSALRTRFLPDVNAPEVQQGSITYNFVVQ